MSLKLAAQHLSNRGRGPDDTLVHMSSREVKSLSDLARAHGGELTINPDTGLPEAGILDSLLPTIVGAGLTYFSGGAINPMTAGFITGGIETLRSGSIEKGLMAGLGAYGGAGLTGGLMGAGEAAIGMGARDAAVQNATQQGLTGEAYNTAVQEQVAQQMAEKATPFGQISEGASQVFTNPGKVMDVMGGGFNTAKYAAGAAAPYLADALKPNVDMPDAGSMQKPVEYRQYKVKRRPDMSYEYEALPVSNTFTPNFADGGGVSDLVNPYLDPSFKFKNVGGPPKVSTSTEMPELKMAEGGRITPEEFYQQYMQQGRNPTDLQYGARGYADTAPVIPTTPYERPAPTPADIVGIDGETYSWDINEGKYVAKPKIATPKTNTSNDTDTPFGTIDGGQAPSISGAPPATPKPPALDPALAQEANNFDNPNKMTVESMLMPTPIKILKTIKDSILYKPTSEALAPVVNMDTLSPAAQAEANQGLAAALADNAQNAVVTVGEGSAVDGDANTTSPSHGEVAPSVTSVNDGDANSIQMPMNLNQVANLSEGVSTSPGNAGSAVGASSGIGGMGTGHAGVTASGGNAANAANAAVGAASSAAASAASSGTSGATSSGMGGMGTGSHGVAATAAATGGGGGGGGCCFIMLEARYGNGTMDRVVRRYRDEKVTERNKRGYYKLAEVFIPLMRKSKLFSLLVVKTFADPAVCYAKWYYGENKWGWVFKPLERFWMGLFDTLGTETKFIRENGEVV